MHYRTFLLAALLTFSFNHQAWSKPIERIISLSPGLTELVYSAGAGEKLVAVDRFSNYPIQVKKLPIIGDANGFSFEKIIELNPDLVLVWGGGTSTQDIIRLQELGLNVKVHHINSLQDIPTMIDELAKLTHSTQGQQVASQLRQIIEHTQAEYQNVIRLSFFYQTWDQPLMTLNGQQFISQAVELCGADNVFHNLPQLAPQINFEQVIALNPDVIFLGARSKISLSWKQTWLAVPDLKASQFQHIFTLDGDTYHRPTERMIRALPALCQQLDSIRINLAH